MNIVFFSLKGGVGKSTLAFCIVSALREAGQEVDFVDLDPQESSSSWLAVDGFTPSHKGSIRIVDTPPRADHQPTLEELKKAHKVFVPSSPSLADIPTAKHTIELIEKLAPQAEIYLVWSRVDIRKKVKVRNMPKMAEQIGASYLKNFTRDLDCFENIAGHGFSALEHTAREDVLKLALECLHV